MLFFMLLSSRLRLAVSVLPGSVAGLQRRPPLLLFQD